MAGICPCESNPYALLLPGSGECLTEEEAVEAARKRELEAAGEAARTREKNVSRIEAKFKEQNDAPSTEFVQTDNNGYLANLLQTVWSPTVKEQVTGCLTPEEAVEAAKKLELEAAAEATRKEELEAFWKSLHLWKDICFWVIFFYYLDFSLDLKMMYTFYYDNTMGFLACNVAGIAFGVLATFGQMLLMVHRGQAVVDGWFLLLLGFATPLQLHVLLLGIHSLYIGEKTPLLFAAKLMESVVEATVSSMVQTYATIFEKLGYTDSCQDIFCRLFPELPATASLRAYFWASADLNMFGTYFWACASISMSYLSIAFCYTSFDKLDTSFLGMPGRAKGFFVGFRPGPLALVFVARICEVTSRMLSLGFFARAVHDCSPWLFPHEKMTVLAAVDLAGNLLMTCYASAYDLRLKEGHLIQALHGMFGVFCYVNPVLERRNVASCLYVHYYIWRVSQLGFMLWLGSSCITWEELQTQVQPELYWALLCTTAGWMILFPIIRYFHTADGLLEWPPEMFAKYRLSKVGELFRDSLLNCTPLNEFHREMLSCESKVDEQAAARCVEFHKVCLAGLSEHVRILEEHNKDDEALCWMPFEALRTSGVNLVPYLKQVVSADSRERPFALRADCFLTKDLSADGDKADCFLTKDHSLAQSELYHRLLRALNHAFSKQDVSKSLILMTGPHLEELQALIPARRIEPGYAGLPLFTEKCRFVEALITVGFQESSKSFTAKAKEILSVFSIQKKADIVFERSVTSEERKKCQQYMLREQSHMLIKVYQKTPHKDLEALFGPTEKELEGSWLCPSLCAPAKTEAAPPDDHLKLQAILDGAVVEALRDRTIVLKTTEHVQALCAVVGNDLRLVSSKIDRAKRDKQPLTETEVKSLRDLGLRGSDSIEELVMTKIVEIEDAAWKEPHGQALRVRGGKSIDLRSILFPALKKNSSVEVELTRLDELDCMCLDVEDLKSGEKPWVVNDTALLHLCRTFYSVHVGDDGTRSWSSEWLQKSNDSRFEELWVGLEALKETLEERACKQLRDSHNDITAWAKRNVDPESPENEKYTLPENFTYGQLQGRKTNNSEQMIVLQEISRNFKHFTVDVKDKFAWSNTVMNKAKGAETGLAYYVKQLGERIDKFWSERDEMFTSYDAIEKQHADAQIEVQRLNYELQLLKSGPMAAPKRRSLLQRMAS